MDEEQSTNIHPAVQLKDWNSSWESFLLFLNQCGKWQASTARSLIQPLNNRFRFALNAWVTRGIRKALFGAPLRRRSTRINVCHGPNLCIRFVRWEYGVGPIVDSVDSDSKTLSSVLSKHFNVGFSVSLFHEDASCIFPSEVSGSGERTAGCGKNCAEDPQKDRSLGRIKTGFWSFRQRLAGWI